MQIGSKSSLDSLKSVFNECGGNRRWVPLYIECYSCRLIYVYYLVKQSARWRVVLRADQRFRRKRFMIEHFIRSESKQCYAILDTSVWLRPDSFHVISMEFLSLRHRRLSFETPGERQLYSQVTVHTQMRECGMETPRFCRVSGDFESEI